MGSFSTEYIIYIREQDGTRTMFSAGELRDRLLSCLGDSGTADDITLALEYSLLNRHDRGAELVFDRGEMDAAVVRLLEDTGFPEAAELYRNGSQAAEELLKSEGSCIAAFLSRHLSCSGAKFAAVCNEVLGAVRKMEINEASPYLYLELARYFSRQIGNGDVRRPDELPKLSPEMLAGLSDKLTPGTEKLRSSQVISIECVAAIFSCVRFYVSMRRFSEYYDVSSPATELLVCPAAEEVSAALEECRANIPVEGNAEKLPCTLMIHELRQFVRDAFCCNEEQTVEQISRELGEAFASRLENNLFKLDFD